MTDHASLHTMLDQLSDDQAKQTENFLNHLLNPPAILSDPQFVALQEKTRQSMEAFHQKAQQAGSGFIGGGMSASSISGGSGEIRRNVHMSSSHVEGDTTIQHSLRCVENQDIEMIEKFRVDRAANELVIEWKAISAGVTHEHESRFPYAPEPLV
jgi:hypothetical protein